MRRARTLLLGGLAAVLVSMAMASATVLSVSGGTLAVFTFPVDLTPPVQQCGPARGPKFPPPHGQGPARDAHCCPERDDDGRPWDSSRPGAGRFMQATVPAGFQAVPVSATARAGGAGGNPIPLDCARREADWRSDRPSGAPRAAATPVATPRFGRPR